MTQFIQPVAEILEAPPMGLLQPFLQPGIFQGIGDLPNFDLATNERAYGGTFSVQDPVPPYLSRAAGDPSEYVLPLITLSFLSGLHGGSAFFTDRVELHFLDELVLFSNLTFRAVRFETLPGISFAFSYLRLRIS